ncbi:SapC family protein [Catenovulum agarivorans DS-2]|uniref:SapC family protein n=1 Tax=Catenovulum agarivorans DS-2 TaxID=1328313 RepID=W7QBL2_9ALTE|nr:SapC family protein [Catenovulum agarivorans]EWH10209.1 SapC family protein [Catenovulum agarivorans DS-2]
MNIIPFDSSKHKKYLSTAPILAAAQQQASNLSLGEIPKASCCWPVFLCRTKADRPFDIKSLMSLTADTNLFVAQSTWLAPYMPLSLAVYPFVLAKQDQGYSIAVRPCPDELFEQGDTLLVNELNQPSVALKQIQQKLLTSLNESAALKEFGELLAEFELTKEINAIVHYADKTKQVLESLITIDEDKLANLSNDQLIQLQKAGYLPLIYAILNSIFQLNALILKHNQFYPSDKVEQVELLLPGE